MGPMGGISANRGHEKPLVFLGIMGSFRGQINPVGAHDPPGKPVGLGHGRGRPSGDIGGYDREALGFGQFHQGAVILGVVGPGPGPFQKLLLGDRPLQVVVQEGLDIPFKHLQGQDQVGIVPDQSGEDSEFRLVGFPGQVFFPDKNHIEFQKEFECRFQGINKSGIVH